MSKIDVYENISIHFWPGDQVKLYYVQNVIQSRLDRCCDFCGEHIHHGDRYFNYRPLLSNTTKNETYIISTTIRIKEECSHFLPCTISELETMYMNMTSIYQNQLDNCSLFPNDDISGINDIDYEVMSRNIGTLSLRKLNRIKPKSY